MTRFSRLISGWLAVSLVTLAALGTSPAFAQLKGFEDLTGDLKSGGATGKAEFNVTLTPSTAKPGDEVTLTIDVKLPAEHYIYATTGEFDGRTRITLQEYGLKEIDEEFVPDREPKSSAEPLFDNVVVSKFHEHVTWKKRYRVAKDSDDSTVAIAGVLTGQYCSEAGGTCIQIQPGYQFHAEMNPPVRFDYDRPAKNSTLKFKLTPEGAKPGDKVTMSIDVKLADGWHTYSMKNMGEGSEPTVIRLLALKGLRPIGDGFQPDRSPVIETPTPQMTQEAFHESVTWSREFEVLPDVKSGEYGVRAQLFYQVCNKGGCITYKTLIALGDVSDAVWEPVEAEVEDVAPPTRSNPDVATPPANPPKPEEQKPAGPVAIAGVQQPQDQGLFGFLITAVGFGFLSLLTPCVFPMVPITVSFFLKQSESQHHRPFAMASVFCGAIVATFTILGVGIAAIFGAAQLNALANNPWLNIAIGTVFVVFALNMLGLFEIRIPSSLLTFTANKEQAGGYVGAMFMALTFTLTSFTCTFAFAGTLLVAAAQGRFYWPIIGMLAFGAAFASPFFVLAMVPSLLKSLPKSGGWMNSVKVVMGLIEVGAAVKFFSVADLVWNPEPVLFDFVFVMIAWLVLSLMIALYLLGVFRLSHDVPPTGISVARLLFVMAFFGLSCNLAVGLVTHQRGGGWIMDQIIAFAPPRFENEAAIEKGGGPPRDLPEPVLAHHGVWFTLDVDKAITHASKQNRPMLFDFTGVNCTNCRLMEIKMAQPEIHGRLDKFVLVQLYADKVPTITDRKEVKRLLKRNLELQEEWFGDVSLPAYAVVTPDGKTILSMYKGLERSDGQFAAFLDEGLKNWEQMQPKAKGVEVVNKP